MSAFADTLEQKWEEIWIEKVEFLRILSANLANCKGQLTGYKLNEKGFVDGIIFNIL